MAAAAMSDCAKDEALVQFLSMTEERVDPDVAHSLLESHGWNVQAAVDTLFGDASGAAAATGTHMFPELGPLETAASSPRSASGAPFRGGGGDFADEMHVDDPVGFNPLQEARRLGASAAAAMGLGGAAGMDQETGDAHLAAAIEASYRDQTSAGREASEEELIAQALRISQQEEDNRQRQALREQQEAELQESILMDRMREEQEIASRKEAEQAAFAAEQREREEAARASAELQAKRARLPDEPPAGEPGRLAVLFRLPGGQRLQRAFRASDPVGSLYDFVDLQNTEISERRYTLIQTMPRKAFDDRQQTLSEAGIQNQCALMVEFSLGEASRG